MFKASMLSLTLALSGIGLGNVAAAEVAGAVAAKRPVIESRGYFLLRPDFRRCVSPLCGGVFARPLNLVATRCGPHAIQAECYVAEVDWSKLQLDPGSEITLDRDAAAGLVVVHGALAKADLPGFPDLLRLTAWSAWRAATDNPPSDAFYRVTDNGIVCITTPCYSLDERLLGTAHRATLSGLDLEPAGATPRQENRALRNLSRQGILVSGEHTRRELDFGISTELVADQFYVKVPRGASIDAR